MQSTSAKQIDAKITFIGENYLSQEPILQPTINRNHMTGRLRQSRRNQQEDCFGLVLWFDRRLRQRSFRIKGCKLLAQRISRFVFTERYFIFRQRSDHPITWKHRASLHHRSRRYRIHSHERRHLYSQFAHEMIRSGFTGVVCQASLLCHHCISTGGDYYVAPQALLLKDLVRFIRDNVSASDIDAKSPRPQTIFDTAGLVRWHEDARSYYHRINSTIRKHHVTKHPAHTLAIGDVT